MPTALNDETVSGTGNTTKSPEERVSELQEVFREVRNNLSRTTEKRRRHCNVRYRLWKPVVSERVLVKQHPQSKAVDQFVATLAPKNDGPFEIIKFISPVIARLKGLDERLVERLIIVSSNQKSPINSVFHFTSLFHRHLVHSNTAKMQTNAVPSIAPTVPLLRHVMFGSRRSPLVGSCRTKRQATKLSPRK